MLNRATRLYFCDYICGDIALKEPLTILGELLFQIAC